MIDLLELALPQEDQPLLSVEQVARRMNVTIFTVRRWLKTGILTGYKVSGEWRVAPSDLEALLRKSKRPKK